MRSFLFISFFWLLSTCSHRKINRPETNVHPCSKLNSREIKKIVKLDKDAFFRAMSSLEYPVDSNLLNEATSYAQLNGLYVFPMGIISVSEKFNSYFQKPGSRAAVMHSFMKYADRGSFLWELASQSLRNRSSGSFRAETSSGMYQYTQLLLIPETSLEDTMSTVCSEITVTP